MHARRRKVLRIVRIIIVTGTQPSANCQPTALKRNISPHFGKCKGNRRFICAVDSIRRKATKQTHFFGSEAQAAQKTDVHRKYCYMPPKQSGIEICRHFYHCRNAAKVYRKLTALKRNISFAIPFCNRIYPSPPFVDTVRQKNLKCHS